MIFKQPLDFLNRGVFLSSTLFSGLLSFRFAELFESIYLCNTHDVQKIKQLATSF